MTKRYTDSLYFTLPDVTLTDVRHKLAFHISAVKTHTKCTKLSTKLNEAVSTFHTQGPATQNHLSLRLYRGNWSSKFLVASLCDLPDVINFRRSTFGTRALTVAGPTVWNSLPDHLRDPAVDSEQFRRD